MPPIGHTIPTERDDVEPPGLAARPRRHVVVGRLLPGPRSPLDFGNELGTIVVVLGQALEAAAERLDKLRDHEGSSAAHRVLRRLRHWRETGVW